MYFIEMFFVLSDYFYVCLFYLGLYKTASLHFDSLYFQPREVASFATECRCGRE